MYSFDYRGEALTLRPEGTAGAARAYVEHAVQQREPVTRWWYVGPDVPGRATAARALSPVLPARRRDLRRRGSRLRRRDDRHARRLPRRAADPRGRGVPQLAGRGRHARPLPRGARPAPDAEGGVAVAGVAAAPRHQPAPHPRLEGRARRQRRQGRARPRTTSSTRGIASTSRSCARRSTRSGRRTRSTRASCAGSTTTRARSSRSKAPTRSWAPAARSSAAAATTAWSPSSAGPLGSGDRLRRRPRAAAHRERSHGDFEHAWTPSSRRSATRPWPPRWSWRAICVAAASAATSTRAEARSRASCGAPTRSGPGWRSSSANRSSRRTSCR